LVWAEAFSGELTVGRRLNAGRKEATAAGAWFVRFNLVWFELQAKEKMGANISGWAA
jgi:hypothetical protein